MYVDKVHVYLLLNNLFETFTKLFIIFFHRICFQLLALFPLSYFVIPFHYYRNPFFILVKHFHSSVSIKS